MGKARHLERNAASAGGRVLVLLVATLAGSGAAFRPGRPAFAPAGSGTSRASDRRACTECSTRSSVGSRSMPPSTCSRWTTRRESRKPSPRNWISTAASRSTASASGGCWPGPPTTRRERAKWIGKIRGVLSTRRLRTGSMPWRRWPSSATRSSDDDVAAMEQAARARKRRAGPYAAWVLANSGQPGGEARLAELLDSPDVEVRRAAAYALRHLPSISASARGEIAGGRRQRAGQVEGPRCSSSPPRPCTRRRTTAALKAELADFAARGTATRQFEACQALAQIGDDSDLPLLTRTARRSEPGPPRHGRRCDPADRPPRAAPPGCLGLGRDRRVCAGHALGGLVLLAAHQDAGAISAGRPPDEAADGRRFAVRLVVQLHFVLGHGRAKSSSTAP